MYVLSLKITKTVKVDLRETDSPACSSILRIYYAKATAHIY